MAVKKATTARTTRTTITKKTTAKHGPEALGARLMAPAVPVIKPLPDFISPAMRKGLQQAERILALLAANARISEIDAALHDGVSVYALFALRADAHRNGLSEAEKAHENQRSENAAKGGHGRHAQTDAVKTQVRSEWLAWKRDDPGRYASNTAFAEAMVDRHGAVTVVTVRTWCTDWNKAR